MFTKRSRKWFCCPFLFCPGIPTCLLTITEDTVQYCAQWLNCIMYPPLKESDSLVSYKRKYVNDYYTGKLSLFPSLTCGSESKLLLWLLPFTSFICVILLGWSQRLAVACGTLLVYRFTCKYWVNETKAAKVFSLEG